MPISLEPPTMFIFELGCVISIILIAVQNSSEEDEIGMNISAANMIRNIGYDETEVFAVIINKGILNRMTDLVPGTIPQWLFDMLPLIRERSRRQRRRNRRCSDDPMAAFIDSVDVTFLFATIVIVLLEPTGIMHKWRCR